MEEVLSACTVVMNIPVAWGEMDAMGHLNNIIYFRYFESVRIDYFRKLDLIGYQQETGIGPILASTECRYKMPLQFPDTVMVGTKILSMKQTGLSWAMKYSALGTKESPPMAKG